MARAGNQKFNSVASARQAGPGRSMETRDKTEIIRDVARRLYEKKGCQPGHDLENWLEAEKLVKSGKM
jgi:hypothetical protein